MHTELEAPAKYSTRKGKEREVMLRDSPQRAPQPTDLDERLMALRRKTAGLVKVKERSERQPAQQPGLATALSVTPSASFRTPRTLSRPSPAPPRRTLPTHTLDTDYDDFSRRLKISSSPAPVTQAKLFNPNGEDIRIRRTAEPDSIQNSESTAHPVRAPQADRSRQLFDPRKDDPVRFSVLARPVPGRPTPTQKLSGDYVSGSSTSSYAASISSAFTLSSTTDGSSASSALFDQRPVGTDDCANSVFSVQLKRLYRNITNLETKIKTEDAPDDPEELGSRVMLKGREDEPDDLERDKWTKQIGDHRRLAEIIHNLLEISLAPSVPVSLRNIPTKYNIIVRLWTYAFHKILESLRRASFTSPLALEHLQDFIYYAYTFYTGLLEDLNLSSFKSGWLEALGDLARYRMAVADMVSSRITAQSSLTVQAISEVSIDNQSKKALGLSKSESVSDAPAARMQGSPSPSVGIVAARLLDVEPEKERWRCIARDWYGAGLAGQPGTGKLHHHLGLLSREVEGEELRAIYHFVKSMTTLHPFPTSRESILHIWSHTAQGKRAQPDARVSDLFVLLHGMLFTNIQLDDFTPTLARFIERLEIEGAEEREWTMMAVINISSMLEYGRTNGILKGTGGIGAREGALQQQAAMKVMMKKAAAGVPMNNGEEGMEVDEPLSHVSIPAPDDKPEHPPPFTYALQLTFTMLSMVLRTPPTRKASDYSVSSLNPYLTTLLTFLATILRHSPIVAVLERSIPWDDLANFFPGVPRKVLAEQGLHVSRKRSDGDNESERWTMLTSGCAPPLNEDWCLRGMEWVGRKVFEHGYWKGEKHRAELDMLEEIEQVDLSDGHIESDEEAKVPSESQRRWCRVVRCGVFMADAIDGFTWCEGTRQWSVDGKLREKVDMWREEDLRAKEEEERRRMGRRWVDDSMDVDEEDVGDSLSDGSEDDKADSPEINALKARRQYLRSLLQSGPKLQRSAKLRSRSRKKEEGSRPSLAIVPGYTVLVVDTNILLSSLSMLSSVIESLRWTVIIPLPVIMELDGLATNDSNKLAEAAQAATAYISTHIRLHSQSLKVQTSKGNYLSTLTFRTEEVDFLADGNMDRNMDDLILKAAIWQDEHWVDRSAILKADVEIPRDAVKVVLLSLDRNLRLKARSRQLPAASEKDLASILAVAT